MKKLLLLFIATMFGATFAFAATIDNFNASVNPIAVSDCGLGGSNSATENGASILGGSGSRTVTVTNNDGNGCVAGSVPTSPDRLLYNSNAGDSGTLSVDAIGGPLALENMAIQLDFYQDGDACGSSCLPTTVLVLLLCSNADCSENAQHSQTFEGAIGSALSLVTVSLNFDGATAGFDLNNVEGYILNIASTGNMDFAIDNIQTNVPTDVPEPRTMVLIGVGLLGLALYRR